MVGSTDGFSSMAITTGAAGQFLGAGVGFQPGQIQRTPSGTVAFTIIPCVFNFLLFGRQAFPPGYERLPVPNEHLASPDRGFFIFTVSPIEFLLEFHAGIPAIMGGIVGDTRVSRTIIFLQRVTFLADSIEACTHNKATLEMLPRLFLGQTATAPNAARGDQIPGLFRLLAAVAAEFPNNVLAVPLLCGVESDKPSKALAGDIPFGETSAAFYVAVDDVFDGSLDDRAAVTLPLPDPTAIGIFPIGATEASKLTVTFANISVGGGFRSDQTAATFGFLDVALAKGFQSTAVSALACPLLLTVRGTFGHSVSGNPAADLHTSDVPRFSKFGHFYSFSCSQFFAQADANLNADSEAGTLMTVTQIADGIN